MNEERARELLEGCITETGLSNSGRYLAWDHKNKEATLDGDFTADDLEAIAWWMRNKGPGVRMEEHEEIRKPGYGHPIMLMAYAVLALFVGLLAWAIY